MSLELVEEISQAEFIKTGGCFEETLARAVPDNTIAPP